MNSLSKPESEFQRVTRENEELIKRSPSEQVRAAIGSMTGIMDRHIAARTARQAETLSVIGLLRKEYGERRSELNRRLVEMEKSCSMMREQISRLDEDERSRISKEEEEFTIQSKAEEKIIRACRSMIEELRE